MHAACLTGGACLGVKLVESGYEARRAAAAGSVGEGGLVHCARAGTAGVDRGAGILGNCRQSRGVGGRAEVDGVTWLGSAE